MDGNWPQERLGVTVDPSRHVIEMDSTTPAKFSRHVLVQLRRAWAHNGHVHAFVQLAASSQQPSGPDQAQASIPGATYRNFWVNKPASVQPVGCDDGVLCDAAPQAPRPKEEVLLIDTGVYTRNRYSNAPGRTRGNLTGQFRSRNVCRKHTVPVPERM